MKKIIAVIGIMFLLSGCGHTGKVEILKELNKNIKSLKSYYIEGEMEIINNEDSYKYDVNVSYMNNNYRVSLINKSNNHEQVILKNKSGTYVLTPSLNKSFKFESTWPNNTSQIYLIESIIKDMNNDSELGFNETNDGYVFTSKVNYPNNKSLVKESICFDKNLNIKSVEVLDNSNNKVMVMKFNRFEKNKKLDESIFELVNENKELDKTVSSIDDAIYPMFLPLNTTLEKQDVVDKEDGERLILTFGGDNPFILIEETVSTYDELEIIPTIGEPTLLIDTIGALSDNSITWISNGIEYYITSDVMSIDDMLTVAKSMSTIPVMK